MKNRDRRTRKLEPFVLPTGRAKELEGVYRALEAQLPVSDSDYPPHDEEKFQEGYPHRGDGGYGSPGKF